MKTACGIADTIQIYNINEDGSFGDLVLETNNNPTKEQLEMMQRGEYNCAFDAITDPGLHDLTTYITNNYNYIGIGNDGTTGDTFNTLQGEIARYAVTSTTTDRVSIIFPYYDVAVFSVMFTATSSHSNVCEAGIFKQATTSGTDVMLCRQVFCDWSILDGQTYGIIWRITSARA